MLVGTSLSKPNTSKLMVRALHSQKLTLEMVHGLRVHKNVFFSLKAATYKCYCQCFALYGIIVLVVDK